MDYQRIIVKIGSNVLTRADGLPDTERIENLVGQLAAVRKRGMEVILVSSGAVASGRSQIKVDEHLHPVAMRQLLASVGQVQLINTYARLFGGHGLLCSQVLVTKEDFRDRRHYRNMQNCLEILLQHGVLPIVNENDVVSVTELMFTDNDELAGLIASMLGAQALIILSNVDGIYTGDPRAEGSRLLEIIDPGSQLSQYITTGKSSFGRGGMLTKAGIAGQVAKLGITVHIANGKVNGVLTAILDGSLPHTRFLAQKNASGKKRWLAHAGQSAKGLVQVNDGALAALTSAKATSLLPVGIVAVEGDFEKGDIIRITNAAGTEAGLGIAEYSAEKARERAGQRNHRPLVHYDYLYMKL
jgi:glutamate 5-kinase